MVVGVNKASRTPSIILSKRVIDALTPRALSKIEQPETPKGDEV